MRNDDRVNQDWDDSDEAFERRRRARAERMAERKRIHQKKMRIRRMIITGVPLAVVLLVFCVIIVKGVHKLNNSRQDESAQEVNLDQTAESSEVDNSPKYEETAYGNADGQINGTDGGVTADVGADDINAGDGVKTVYAFSDAPAMAAIPAEVVSTSVIFIDKESGEILAGRDARTRISPASMTKILTVLVAAEHVDNLDDTFTITREITDYGYVNDCSAAGFLENETVSVRDLFYGTILPSGADAGVGLATYVAGSQEAFVDLMNEKLKELGISDTTHFTNCVGIYDENHYSTPYDMAVILRAALDNELCREVMSAHSYTTSATEQHPEGIIISNWFLRRIEDKDTGGEVICAKTGFVAESGSCAASYGKAESGKEYLCVTAGSSSSWRCIYDHVALYKQFSGGA